MIVTKKILKTIVIAIVLTYFGYILMSIVIYYILAVLFNFSNGTIFIGPGFLGFPSGFLLLY